MSIPVSDGWMIAIGTTVVAWASWITRRSYGTLTRAEHDAICQAHHVQNTVRLDSIVERMTDADKSREKMAEMLSVLKDRSDRDERRQERTFRGRDQ